MEKTCYNCGSPISKETCEEFPEICEHWSPKKPITNADGIRAMTDKELADFLIMVGDGSTPEKMVISVRDIRFEQKMWLDWLKQEIKDE